MVITGAQSASLWDGPLVANYLKLAKWLMEKNGAIQHNPQQQLQQPATRTTSLTEPTVSSTVTVQRDAYVELKCPLAGSPVTWTVISGESDGIRTQQLLVFPRMTGDVSQEYHCQVSNQVASLHVHIVDDIPVDRTLLSNLCEHGKICPISCGDVAEWDGVASVKEHWTPLQWPTQNQVIHNCYCAKIYLFSFYKKT